MTTTPPSPSRFADVLRAEGATVVEVGDWETHNRNSKGPWGPVHGVVIHHTVTKGSATTVRICRDGYSGLPGPLCHGVITKDGKVHLVGYGRANHAGLGDPDVLAAVIAERSTLPVDNQATVDGNRAFYGFECENMGDGQDPWPAAQLEAIERVSAAICRHHGWSERSVIGHLEWQPGKVDPRGFTMDSMRERIRTRLAGGPDKPTPPPSTGTTYTVKPGDTLSGIAKAHGVTADALYAANKEHIKNKNEIFPGQELVIPKAAPLPKPVKPVVDLSKLVAAAKSNPAAKGTPVTYTGVRTVETALVDAGLLEKKYSDGHFGSSTVDAYAAWQRSRAGGGYRGDDANGIPGRDSLKRLGDKYGFTVVA
jgi:LysM repeat protein